jgi:hypothetical protein
MFSLLDFSGFGLKLLKPTPILREWVGCGHITFGDPKVFIVLSLVIPALFGRKISAVKHRI